MCFGSIRSWFGRSSVFGGIFQYFNRSSQKSSYKMREKAALIVVDMQNDFLLPDGGLTLHNCPSKHDGEEAVPVINKLQEEVNFDEVIFTLDWHPADHISFVTNVHKHKLHSSNKTDIDSANVLDKVIFDCKGNSMEQILWPVHCVQHSTGAELHKDLRVNPGSIHIKKGKNASLDSYSAFFDNKKLGETELQKVLREKKITTVFVCGVATDVCVNYTAFDAHDLGFKTYVVTDACRGVSNEGIEETFEKMKKAGIFLVTSDQVVDTVMRN